MRNRIEGLEDLEEAVHSEKISDELLALTTKLDDALREIVELKTLQATQIVPDTEPWIFDIKRDGRGRIKGVIANKGDKQKLLL